MTYAPPQYPAPYPNAPYPYMTYPYQFPPAPPTDPTLETPAAEEPKGLWPGRYSKIVGIVVIVLTVLAIGLAALAPYLVEHTSDFVPSGWAKVYDATPRGYGADWDPQSDCKFTQAGLHVEDGFCAFLESKNTDLTSQGVYVQATVAPPSAVESEMAPVIAFKSDHTYYIEFDQLGDYFVCSDACGQNDELAVGETDAWYTNGFSENVIGVLYTPSDRSLSLFANGQALTTLSINSLNQATIGLGAPSDGEAIFTHVTIFSASAETSS